MFAMHDQRFRDILVLAAGFLGILWFFLHIGNHWIASTARFEGELSSYENKADSLFQALSYQPVDYLKETVITNRGLDLDSLQKRYGAKELISRLRKREQRALPVYRAGIRMFENDFFSGGVDTRVRMELSQSGELVEFFVSPNLVNNQTPFNRKLMAEALKESFGLELSPALVDTLISGIVDFQHNREGSTSFRNMLRSLQRLPATGDNSLNSFMKDDNVWWAVRRYIDQSYWSDFEFKKDSLVRDDINGYKVAKAYLSATEPVMDITPKLTVEILPAGSLHLMKADYFESSATPDALREFLESVILFLVLIFIVWLLTIFYLRIKARAIDTRPAFIVAFLAGIMVSTIYILNQFGASDFRIVIHQMGITSLLFILGIMGAVSAIGFFLLTSVSDSVTRQYWPTKLRTWDLVRRGMFNNKPVGWAIVRGLAFGGILTGVYVLLLDFIPGTFLFSEVSFDSSEFLFSSAARLILNLLISMIVIVPVFMIVINQIRSRMSKNWVTPVVAGFCFMFITPLNLEVFPFENGLIVNFVLGALLGVCYIYFDFLTLMVAFFTYLNLVLTKQGWLISGSPDVSVFVVFVVISLLLLTFSILFIINGNEKDQLPDYIPDYLEDLAKEQRVAQELEIARNVQKAFLPNTTPDVPGFDTAAICEPAQDTGGDYYDIICIDDDKAAIAIGDVSGKGIQAAFYMTFAKGVIHSLSSIFPSPKMMLYRVNKLFNQNATRGAFISMIYGVLDPADRSFTYIRAGHNPMLLKKADGEMKWLQPKGVAIGMTKGEAFNKVVEEDTITIGKGDVLILYTDGITEAQNEQEVFYDEKRLYKLLKREKTDSAKELRNLIIEDVRTFMGNAHQYDDMTLVVIKG